MKKLFCIALIMGLLLAGVSMAYAADVQNGEFDLMYYAGGLSGSGTTGYDSTTAPGYLARFGYFTGGPLKLGLDYAMNTNNTNNFSNKINDLKFHVKYAPWRTRSYNFGIGLFYNSLRYDSCFKNPATNALISGGATFNGLGIGVDGRVKMSEKTGFYGQIDYAPSLSGSINGVDTKLDAMTYEFGLNFHTKESMMIKLGYRSSALKNKTTPNRDTTLSGLLIGLGFDF
ncbi:MAG: hypothetical protein M1269_03560 [Chloroflexi bacterium]|nr:hypothetical protein [Chloroflexota bacterium]